MRVARAIPRQTAATGTGKRRRAWRDAVPPGQPRVSACSQLAAQPALAGIIGVAADVVAAIAGAAGGLVPGQALAGAGLDRRLRLGRDLDRRLGLRLRLRAAVAVAVMVLLRSGGGWRGGGRRGGPPDQSRDRDREERTRHHVLAFRIRVYVRRPRLSAAVATGFCNQMSRLFQSLGRCRDRVLAWRRNSRDQPA